MVAILRCSFRHYHRIANYNSTSHAIAGANALAAPQWSSSSTTTCAPPPQPQPPSVSWTTRHRLHFRSIPLPVGTPFRTLSFSNSASITSANANDVVIDETILTKLGTECYQRALDALEHSSRIQKLHEELLLKEQFEAMERQRQKKSMGRNRPRQVQQTQTDAQVPRIEGSTNTKDHAVGMAVIRTIVKQSQKLANERPEIQVERWTAAAGGDSNGSCSGDTTTCGHQPGNNDYENDEEYWKSLARQYMEESALRYGYGLALVQLGNDALERAKEEDAQEEEKADASSTSSRTTPCLFDVERCKQWIDESPIQLATILNLVASGRSDNSDGNDASSQMSYHRRLALHLYAAASTRGSPEGYYNHGHLLWDAFQFTSAMISFYKAMELGDADAMYFVAAQYLSYEDEESNDDEAGSGNDEFSLTAIHDEHGATIMEMLHTPNVASRDTPTPLPMAHPIHRHGLALLRHAAHQYSHGPALHHLALLHNEHGNIQDFCNYLTKAANMGNPDSLFLQGHCRYFGTDGFDKDASAAMMDFMAAAENGHVDAMVSAGALLHRGVMSDDGKKIIIERDQRRAFELYQRAGELGSIEGWRNVVSCYATGEGVPMCMDTAKYIANTMLKE